MTADNIEIFVLDSSALVRGSHGFPIILRWAASCHGKKLFLHGFLVILVGLAEEVSELWVSEDLGVHTLNDGLNGAGASKSFVQCHLCRVLFL